MLSLKNCVVVRKLGQGAYGEVYLAKLKGSGKMVAIKCIPKSKLNKRAQDNLVSEISILQKLRHPHIVRLIDFSWDSERVYLFMEYCAGGDLSQFIRTKRHLPEQVVRHFLRQLALALQYLHKKNIVHMDLKPQNILLTSGTNPILKVSDFGFAQCHKETVKTNELRGTLLYMAPEIYCEGVYHPSCDLWSVGVILYECIFGSAPYAFCDSRTLREKLIAGEAIKLPTYIPISAECAALVKGLLKRNPAERMNHEDFFAHPFLDLKHAPSAKSLDKALEFLESAWDFEKRGDLKPAHEHYTRGLAYLLSAVEYQTSPEEKAELRHLAVRYFEQAEKVKNLLDEKKLAPANRPERPPRPKLPPAFKNPDTAATIPINQPLVLQKSTTAVGCPPSRARLQRQMTAPARPDVSPKSVLAKSLTNSASPGNHSTSVGRIWDSFWSLLLGKKPKEKSNCDPTSDENPPIHHEVVVRASTTSQPIEQKSCPTDLSLPSVSQRTLLTPNSFPATELDHLTPSPENFDDTTKLSTEIAVPSSSLSQLVNRSERVADQVGSCPDASSTESFERHQTHTAASEIITSSDSGSPFSSDESDQDSLKRSVCRGRGPEKLARLRTLSTYINPRILDNAASDADQTSPILPENPAVLSNMERLCELKDLCDTNDTKYRALVELLEKFYCFFRSSHVDLAVQFFQTNFTTYIDVAKSDPNEARRRAFLRELKLVLDLVENSQHLRKVNPISPSEQQNISSPSGFPPVVQEVGIELKETIDADQCRTS